MRGKAHGESGILPSQATGSIVLLGVIRFRRGVLRSDRASRILVGLVKKREKQ